MKCTPHGKTNCTASKCRRLREDRAKEGGIDYVADPFATASYDYGSSSSCDTSSSFDPGSSSSSSDSGSCGSSD